MAGSSRFGPPLGDNSSDDAPTWISIVALFDLYGWMGCAVTEMRYFPGFSVPAGITRLSVPVLGKGTLWLSLSQENVGGVAVADG